MKPNSEFLDYVLDQLAGLGEVRARRMFGGAGLYCGGTFFAIVHGDTLYLKVDDATRADCERAGAGPFRPFAHRPPLLRYYAVPADVLDEAPELRAWAQRAVTVTRHAPATGARRRRSVPIRRPAP